MPDIVSTAYSEVRAAVSPDGNTVLWGSTDRPGGPGGWDIWMVRRAHGVWSSPAPVPFDTTYKEFDPAFSADGRSVWFFSNRPGGFGGDDIYRVDFDPHSGRFGKIEHPDDAINSAGDEWAPSPSPDGRHLLFATNGRGGSGRHDLFVSEWRDGAWQSAAALPGEVNSADDDFDATYIDSGRALVFARSADVDNQPIELWMATRDSDGTYRHAKPLDRRVNVAGSWTLGPAEDLSRPGTLLFSARRPEAQRGKSDIYAIRLNVQAQRQP
ncbi:WD40 repeat protein [Luteibacter rhizovicinus]|uniref:WD40 repeat protein n=1 Tax=Luteibacter rhizovicinus TaxID=242606 RepID=A0A4R3YMS5_9GAMM|nr:PD40 domain-containing protein [Luteibacter rhizovicinus]TCV94115.1 WD40 repeat protein [Luteibacter rhizovicinus]